MKEQIEEFLESLRECSVSEVEAVYEIASWTSEKRAAFMLAHQIWKDAQVDKST